MCVLARPVRLSRGRSCLKKECCPDSCSLRRTAGKAISEKERRQALLCDARCRGGTSGRRRGLIYSSITSAERQGCGARTKRRAPRSRMQLPAVLVLLSCAAALRLPAVRVPAARSPVERVRPSRTRLNHGRVATADATASGCDAHVSAIIKGRNRRHRNKQQPAARARVAPGHACNHYRIVRRREAHVRGPP